MHARPADFGDSRPDDHLADSIADLAAVVDRHVREHVRPRPEVADCCTQRIVARFVEIDVVDGVVEMTKRVEVRPAGGDAELARLYLFVFAGSERA
jgi:hypothetical protein